MFVFRSNLYPPLRKYCVKDMTWFRHCSIELRKHEFPRFCRPTDPGAGGTPLMDSRTKPAPWRSLWDLRISTRSLDGWYAYLRVAGGVSSDLAVESGRL